MTRDEIFQRLEEHKTTLQQFVAQTFSSRLFAI